MAVQSQVPAPAKGTEGNPSGFKSTPAQLPKPDGKNGAKRR